MKLLRRILFWFYTLLGLEAVRLNLRVGTTAVQFFNNEGWAATDEWMPRHDPLAVRDYFNARARSGTMAKIGDTFTATIKPTNAAGASAPVFSSVFTASGGYDFSVATDGLSATFVAKTSGTGFSVTVTAISKSGATLTDTKPLPDVEFPAVDDEAVALNLTVA